MILNPFDTACNTRAFIKDATTFAHPSLWILFVISCSTNFVRSCRFYAQFSTSLLSLSIVLIRFWEYIQWRAEQCNGTEIGERSSFKWTYNSMQCLQCLALMLNLNKYHKMISQSCIIPECKLDRIFVDGMQLFEVNILETILNMFQWYKFICARLSIKLQLF